MATYVLIHGGAHGAWSWHLLERELRSRGHDVVAVDLPIDDESAGLDAYAATVVDAVGDRRQLVVVAHSLGGLTGPLVCARLPVDLLVLLAAMVPAPGETCVELLAGTGFDDRVANGDPDGLAALDPLGSEESAIAAFYHDVPDALAREAVAHLRPQAFTPMLEPWPLEEWPDVPTRYLLCRDDRMVRPEWSRAVVRERLGIECDEMDGSHSPFLSRPVELADRLESLRRAAS